MQILEDTVLHGVNENLTDPKALAEYTKAYHARWAERQKEIRGDRDAAQRQLNRVTVQIDRIVDAITDSDEPVKMLMDKMKRLEIERAGLEEKLRLIDADGTQNVVSLHPVAIDKFSASITALHDALTSLEDADARAPFHSAFRNVFERIIVHPTGKRMPYEVTPYARLSAIMGVELFPKTRTPAEMLAEQGSSRSDLANTGKSVSS